MAQAQLTTCPSACTPQLAAQFTHARGWRTQAAGAVTQHQYLRS